jgi:hypothetical protein
MNRKIFPDKPEPYRPKNKTIETKDDTTFSLSDSSPCSYCQTVNNIPSNDVTNTYSPGESSSPDCSSEICPVETVNTYSTKDTKETYSKRNYQKKKDAVTKESSGDNSVPIQSEILPIDKE